VKGVEERERARDGGASRDESDLAARGGHLMLR
jgi:hypothetical protein